jgi:hypothetical protein
MNPDTYQQLMIQQLMQGGSAAPGTGMAAPATPYGQAFVTGNQFMPNAQGSGMLGTSAPSSTLMQPMAAYPSASQAQSY